MRRACPWEAPHCAYSPMTERRVWAHNSHSQTLHDQLPGAMSTWLPCYRVLKIILPFTDFVHYPPTLG